MVPAKDRFESLNCSNPAPLGEFYLRASEIPLRSSDVDEIPTLVRAIEASVGGEPTALTTAYFVLSGIWRGFCFGDASCFCDGFGGALPTSGIQRTFLNQLPLALEQRTIKKGVGRGNI